MIERQFLCRCQIIFLTFIALWSMGGILCEKPPPRNETKTVTFTSGSKKLLRKSKRPISSFQITSRLQWLNLLSFWSPFQSKHFLIKILDNSKIGLWNSACYSITLLCLTFDSIDGALLVHLGYEPTSSHGLWVKIQFSWYSLDCRYKFSMKK